MRRWTHMSATYSKKPRSKDAEPAPHIRSGSHDHRGSRCCCCEAESLLTPIELNVVLAHEDVTKNPQGARRNIDAHQAKNARAARLLQGQLLLVEGEVLASEVKCQVWNVLGAIERVLLTSNQSSTD